MKQIAYTNMTVKSHVQPRCVICMTEAHAATMKPITMAVLTMSMKSSVPNNMTR